MTGWPGVRWLIRCLRSWSCRERTSDQIMRASLSAAIFHGWPVPAISQQSEARGLRDGGRPRGAAQLAADVGDVAVHGMRAQHELLGDLVVAETARDAG